MSADLPSKPTAAATRQKAGPAGIDLPTSLLFGSAFVLGLTLLFTEPIVAFGTSLLAGVAGAVACGLLARRDLPPPAGAEPWRFDGYCVVLATLALLALAASVGPEAAPVAWLLVALLVALALAGIGAPQPR